jgi:hypothetical protein
VTTMDRWPNENAKAFTNFQLAHYSLLGDQEDL